MSYTSEVLADTPAVYLPMQETSGTTAVDSSGNGRDGSYVNGVTLNDSTDPACPTALGKHVRLDGTDDHVLLNNATVWMTPATSGFTFECWVYLRSYADYQRFFDFSNNASSPDDMYWIPRNNASQTQVKVNNTSATSSTLMSTAAWHHIVLTVNTSGVAIAYVDGSVVLSGTVGSPVNQARQFKYVGRSAWPGDPYLPASITQVAVYNAVLSSTRISAHYSAGVGTTGTTLNLNPVTARAVTVITGVSGGATPSAYQLEVIKDAPAVFHPMQESSGTLTADIVGDLNGSYVNGPGVNDSTDPACPSGLGRHVRLDGTDDHVLLNSTTWLTPATNGFTLECWVYVRSWVAFIRFFSFTNALNANDMSLSTWPNASSLDLSINGADLQYGSVFSSGAWHHVVVTVTTAGAAKIYVDGSVFATGTTGVPVNQARQYKFLGRSSYGSDPYLPASYSNVAVYNSVLSPTRISAHYAAGIASGPKTLSLNPVAVAVTTTVTLTKTGGGGTSKVLGLNMLGVTVALAVTVAKVGSATPGLTGWDTGWS